MNAIRLAFSLLLISSFGFAFTGCMSRPAPELAKEGNSRLATAKTMSADLKDNYGIDLVASKPAEAKAFKWNKFSSEQRTMIQAKLKAYVANVTRINQIAKDKKMTIEGDQDWLNKSAENAQLYLDSSQG